MVPNIIKVESGKLEEIMKVFKVSKPYVSMALNGKRNGELAKKIRHVALTQYDGQEFQPVKQ